MSEAAGIGLAEVLRVVAALALVSALTVGLGWLARARHRRGAGASLRVEERLTISRTAQLLVVRAGGRKLLVGASDKGVQLVTELDPVEVPQLAPEGDEAKPSSSHAAAKVPGAFARLLAGKLHIGEGSSR
jgi:flagellar biogenesis protein FliO